MQALREDNIFYSLGLGIRITEWAGTTLTAHEEREDFEASEFYDSYHSDETEVFLFKTEAEALKFSRFSSEILKIDASDDIYLAPVIKVKYSGNPDILQFTETVINPMMAERFFTDRSITVNYAAVMRSEVSPLSGSLQIYDGNQGGFRELIGLCHWQGSEEQEQEAYELCPIM